MKAENMMHLEGERLPIRKWMHRIYLDECYIHVPQRGGWAT